MTFTNPCTCGGYAWPLNGRAPEQPHMQWCSQYHEYAAWYADRRKFDREKVGVALAEQETA